MGNGQSAETRKVSTDSSTVKENGRAIEKPEAALSEKRVSGEAALQQQQPQRPVPPAPPDRKHQGETVQSQVRSSTGGTELKRERRVTLPPGLDAGDIVLFNRRCLAMAPLGALICAVAKAMSNSRWDHVGIVVRKEDGSLHLLEANLSGVTLRPLDERIRRSRSNEIAFRRLSIIRTERFRTELLHFAEQVLETPYKNDLGAMLVSVIHPADMQERERLHALLVSRRAQRMEVERELREAALTAFQRNSLLEQRRILLQSEEKIEEVLRRELAATKGGFFEGSNDLSRVFCSELVAAAYQRLGLLSSFPPADSYVPKDFSTEQANPPGVHLLKNARLGNEEFIRRLPTQKQGWFASLLGSDSNQDRTTTEATGTNPADEAVPGTDANAAGASPVSDASGQPAYPRGESRELIRDALKRTPIFAALPDEYTRNHLVKSFRPVIVEAGDYVFHQGDYGDAFYVVESGSLDRYIAKDGQEPIQVSTLGPRNSFGLTALFFNAAGRSSTIRARERSLLWRLDRATFERFALDFGETSVIENAAESRQLRALLKKHFLFSRLDRIGPKELESFFTVNFRPGETVFEQGEKGDNFYIVKSGVLERWISKPGHQPKLAGTLQPGDSFGELSLMYNAPRGATVRARTDVELWAISAESFHRLHLGGGACYLERIFKEYASVKREKSQRTDDGDPYEYFMTPEDFLRFARADAFKESPEDYRRLSNLLLRLVSNNNSGSLTAPQRKTSQQSAPLIDFWEFVRFDLLLNQPDAESQLIFRLCDRDNTGQVGMQEFQEMFLEYANGDREIEAMVEDGSPLLRQLFGKRGDRKLNFRDFTAASEGKLPAKFLADIHRLKAHMQQQAARAPSSNALDDEILLSTSSLLAGTPQFSGIAPTHRGVLIGHVAGVAVAGVLARTLVAPLDRLKVLMQTESIVVKVRPELLKDERIAPNPRSKRIYSSVWRGFRNMIAQDGILGMYRGNGANALRILPATIIQSATIALAKEYIEAHRPENARRSLGFAAWDTVVIAGLGGIVAATITYPLDTARARLTVQHRGIAERYHGVLQCLREVRKQQGVPGLYRGLLSSTLGVFPYVGINFAVYETLRPIMPRRNDGSGRPTAGGLILSGFIASTLGQMAAYPFDTCRVRMQVDEGSGGRFRQVFRTVLKEEGIRGLYRGLVPNILKAWPTVAVSFYAYEMLRKPLSQMLDSVYAPASGLKPTAAAQGAFDSR
ncbi:similar to mitochondrial calcium-dependent solute carrier [Cyanidioschyzon merolae strain 10D]|jgi:solute carrier family 25 phosphate transporter 23/24/25/41|uniref:Similar to mitochondrial calcium-dependent solute carrier n=1 Tax=Cyanidioschyzon merolae (strain NIES-3377 / 10D) TaxID=280699 RepID=M1VD17_CYAM1|nr:similar to mitochondrial calcium-dependent solute carrier [Cyanidioschyzon merolae strain 10D]BAM83499.1 similar to mitochondrial calcium-dependent solute carrier [Cyanidioschyzon merolae strain 10D]|eukprot:XP_005539535.1 similar to mitochondrial calcium-dependent solute carrier [Cyanidioschyzon merolae strain 10D]